jgi:hypothetical protein
MTSIRLRPPPAVTGQLGKALLGVSAGEAVRDLPLHEVRQLPPVVGELAAQLSNEPSRADAARHPTSARAPRRPAARRALAHRRPRRAPWPLSGGGDAGRRAHTPAFALLLACEDARRASERVIAVGALGGVAGFFVVHFTAP